MTEISCEEQFKELIAEGVSDYEARAIIYGNEWDENKTDCTKQLDGEE